MISLKTTIKTECVYSDDRKKRYCFSLEWDKQKKKAVVIMVSAGRTDGVSFDSSTNLVLSNLVPLDYGSVKIVNLFATMGNGKSVIEKASDDENIGYIINAVTSADTVIYAAGTGHMNNKAFRNRQKDLTELMSDYEDKLMCIADICGKRFYHPLCPAVREWELVPFTLSDLAELTAVYEGAKTTDVEADSAVEAVMEDEEDL